MKKLLLALIVTIVAAAAPISVSAQQSGLAVSPPSFELTAKPGEVVKNIVKVENITDHETTIVPRADNFTAQGIEGQVQLTDEDKQFGIAKWISFDKDAYVIAPKSTAIVNYTITVPQTVDPGSHYGALIFATTAEKGNADSNTAQVVQEVGSLILMRLPGNVTENAKLVSFTPSESTYRNDHVKLSALVENDGTVHVKPSGTIEIQNFMGSTVKTINVTGKNILPSSRRDLSSEFTFDGFGSYTAKLTLVYGDKSQKIEGTTSFMMVNTALVIRYASILIILIVLYLLFKRRINKALKALMRG